MCCGVGVGRGVACSYGAHPFYLEIRGSAGNTHGVFLRNSNGMDVILNHDPNPFGAHYRGAPHTRRVPACPPARLPPATCADVT
jgi:hypothetical protein